MRLEDIATVIDSMEQLNFPLPSLGAVRRACSPAQPSRRSSEIIESIDKYEEYSNGYRSCLEEYNRTLPQVLGELKTGQALRSDAAWQLRSLQEGIVSNCLLAKEELRHLARKLDTHRSTANAQRVNPLIDAVSECATQMNQNVRLCRCLQEVFDADANPDFVNSSELREQAVRAIAIAGEAATHRGKVRSVAFSKKEWNKAAPSPWQVMSGSEENYKPLMSAIKLFEEQRERYESCCEALAQCKDSLPVAGQMAEKLNEADSMITNMSQILGAMNKALDNVSTANDALNRNRKSNAQEIMEEKIGRARQQISAADRQAKTLRRKFDDAMGPVMQARDKRRRSSARDFLEQHSPAKATLVPPREGIHWQPPFATPTQATPDLPGSFGPPTLPPEVRHRRRF